MVCFYPSLLPVVLYVICSKYNFKYEVMIEAFSRQKKIQCDVIECMTVLCMRRMFYLKADQFHEPGQRLLCASRIINQALQICKTNSWQ